MTPDFPLPSLYARQVDYEIELAIVIGRTMSETPERNVMEQIFGYTILHDVSARDIQFRGNQITLGKNFYTFCPIGPGVVTADEISHPDRIGLRTFLNKQEMQEGSTADWLFSLPQLLSFLSQRITLEPGDLASTGTPVRRWCVSETADLLATWRRRPVGS